MKSMITIHESKKANEKPSFIGWFYLEESKEIAKYRVGDPAIEGKRLLITRNNNLIINEWDNTGMDIYRLAKDDNELAEIIAMSNYLSKETDENIKQLIDEIIRKYEL